MKRLLAGVLVLGVSSCNAIVAVEKGAGLCGKNAAFRLSSAAPGGVSYGNPRPKPELNASLAFFDSCDQYNSEMQLQAKTYGTSYAFYGSHNYGDGYSNTYIPSAQSNGGNPGGNSDASPKDDDACMGEDADESFAGGTARKSAKSESAAAPSVQADAATSGGSDGGSDSGTNVQVQGVDEADSYKIGAHHIYALQGPALRVVDRETLAYLGDLAFTDLSDVQIFTDDDRLIAYGVHHSPPFDETILQIYTAAAGQKPELVSTQTFMGAAVDARMIDGRLILVLLDVLPISGVEETPVVRAAFWQPSTAGSVGCAQIARPAITDGDLRMVKVASLNTRAPDEAVHWAAVQGGYDLMYMTEKNLYIGKQMQWWENNGNVNGGGTQNEKFVVTKVDFDGATGELNTSAVGAVDGRVKDQWAFNEYAAQGVLSLATTTGQIWAGAGDPASNHLWILKQTDQTLEIAAGVHGFGMGEDIRSVRYIGDIAYVVTFKKTDPLYGFDLSDALHPKELGELKIPGFSMYMHPVAPGRMMGVGFDAADQGDFAWFQGIQLSLFDVSDPLDFKRLDNIVVGSRGTASDVTSDHHAYFYDQERALAAVPLVEVTGGQAGTSQLGTALGFSGVVFYHVQDKLEEVGRVSHRDLMAPDCQRLIGGTSWWENKTVSYDVNRVFLVDGKLLSLSRFGIKAHAPEAPGEALQATTFPQGAACPSNGDLGAL